MPEIPKIVLPHGGYGKLIVYRKSDVVYEGTVMFCRRFLPAHGDRTVDQMTQPRAAASRTSPRDARLPALQRRPRLSLPMSHARRWTS